MISDIRLVEENKNILSLVKILQIKSSFMVTTLIIQLKSIWISTRREILHANIAVFCNLGIRSVMTAPMVDAPFF